MNLRQHKKSDTLEEKLEGMEKQLSYIECELDSNDTKEEETKCDAMFHIEEGKDDWELSSQGSADSGEKSDTDYFRDDSMHTWTSDENRSTQDNIEHYICVSKGNEKKSHFEFKMRLGRNNVKIHT